MTQLLSLLGRWFDSVPDWALEALAVVALVLALLSVPAMLVIGVAP